MRKMGSVPNYSNKATAIAVVLLIVSFAMLVLINVLERWSKGGAARA